MESLMSDPPGPKTRTPGHQFFAFRRDPLAFMQQLARDYGDIAFFKVGPQRAYLLNHPDLIKDVFVTHHDYFHKGRTVQRMKYLLGEGLITSEGEHYRRQRRLAQPAFHKQRIASYGEAMVKYSERAASRYRDGQMLDVAQEMMSIALAIVGKTLFDTDLEEEDAGKVSQGLTNVMESFELLMLPLFNVIEKLPLPAVRRLRRARSRMDEIIYQLIAERRESRADHGDLLSMLLLALDEEGDGGGMTNEQLRDEVMTIYLAGHETTANALAWTWYLLSQHPEVEAELHREIDAVLEGGRLPTTADLARLRYTEMVVAEAMRLYPPAWLIGRRAIREYAISDYVVPVGSLVFSCPYVMHRHERYYPDPLRFDPLRWTPEAKATRPQFSYFPFGGGPRRCIGESFAWMEAVLVVATLARHWRMRLVPGHTVALMPRLTLRPKHGLAMTLQRRERR